MNKRDNSQIPLGEPTDIQLTKINEQLDILKTKGSKSINIGRAFVPSNFENIEFIKDFTIGREQCNFASNFLDNPKRELVFALLNYPQPNGFALPCENFDAVLITTGFFVNLNKLTDRVFTILFNGDMSAITGEKNFKNDFLSYCKDQQIDCRHTLQYLTRHLAIGHIIGHEFGHLASGHCGFANSIEEFETESDDYSLAANFSDISTQSLLSQAREIDADVRAAWWIKYLLNQPISPNHLEIHKWLKADSCRLTFIFSLSSLLWYVTLGAARFSSKNLNASTTHPPTSLRAKTIFDSAVMQDVQRDYANRYRHESFALEASYLVGLSEVLRREEYLKDMTDENSKKELYFLRTLSKIDLINKCLGEMGLSTPNDKHQIDIRHYINRMSEISAADRKRTAPFARWKERYRINWGLQNNSL